MFADSWNNRKFQYFWTKKISRYGVLSTPYFVPSSSINPTVHSSRSFLPQTAGGAQQHTVLTRICKGEGGGVTFTFTLLPASHTHARPISVGVPTSHERDGLSRFIFQENADHSLLSIIVPYHTVPSISGNNKEPRQHHIHYLALNSLCAAGSSSQIA